MLQFLKDRKQFLIIKKGFYSTLAFLLEGETIPVLKKKKKEIHCPLSHAEPEIEVMSLEICPTDVTFLCAMLFLNAV